MGDGKCNVLQYLGTNRQDEKYSLQRSFLIMKNTHSKYRYISTENIKTKIW
jgi:hypothetical protein